MSDKKPLIVLTGPTAVGKTELSILLAKRIGGEIISADSMQVYRGMDIGSAKIRKDEMEDVPHHLIDVLDPTEEFNITLFKEMAGAALDKIYKNGHIPIVTGGTGFYIQALLYDVQFAKESDDHAKLYEKYEEILKEDNGAHLLWERLNAVDPAYTKMTHENNVKRIMRALAFYEETGQRLSMHNEEQRENESPYNFAYYVITDDREIIYDRINKRVDKMVADGLVEEVSKLKQMGLTRQNLSMQGIGYKEILDYLDDKCSLEEALYVIKRDSRHFAKRQLTWFRREKTVTYLDKQILTDSGKMLDFVVNDLKEKEIII